MKKLVYLLSIALMGMVIAIGFVPRASGQEETATPDHNAHHPTATPDHSTTPMPDDHNAQHSEDEDPMAMMQGMMTMMMGMEMSDEMQPMMAQMQGMMDMMSMMSDAEDHHNMMQAMQSMMDMMMGMEMSEEMHTQMSAMMSMMDMMMSSTDGTGDHGDHQMPGMTMPNTDGTDSQGDHQMSSSGDHAMQPIDSVGVPFATETRGGQLLPFVEEDGVKIFELTAMPVIWNLTDDTQVTAWTYNGTVPGPMIRVTEGDMVRIVLTNNLPEPTTIHWHGIQVPNAMDGVPGLTQDPVQPGETFVYEFVAKPAGTFMYHPHFNSDTQIGLGLYAPFIIDPATQSESAPDVDVSIMLSEWRVDNGMTYAAMPMAGMEPNYFTFNGKSFPTTETLDVQQGQRVRIRLYGIGQFSHPIHLHGVPFKVVAIDGMAIPEEQQLSMDTVNVAPGQRYDIEFVATESGKWMLHCHIPHHTTNGSDHGSEGGMMMVVNVTE